MQTFVFATARVTVLMVALGACCAGCEDDGKPPTFHDACDPDAGKSNCDEPFECFEVSRQKDDPEPVPICTKACKHDSECPRWYNESGHCAGDFQTVCLLGYCQGWCI
jgi:hypothetical protein